MKWFKGNWVSRLFDNDLFLKVISVIIAVVGWLMVAMIVSPDTEGTINNIPVRIAVEDSTAQRLGLDVVEGGDQTISVNVAGKRYVLGGLTASDFNVVAYPTSVTAAGEYELEVVVSKIDANKEFDILSWTPEKITVRFDRMATKTISLAAQAENVKVASGYILDDPVATASPKEVTITGPEQYLNLVDKCVVRTELSDELSSTTVTKGTLEIYDQDGQLMDPEEYKFTLSSKEFSVTIPVLKQKTLPLTFDYLNVPAGFSTSSLKYTMSSKAIQVAGPVEVIDSMSELKVGYVDFKELDLDYSKEFEIELPTGFKNSTNLTTVTVTFDTSNLTSKNTWISYNNLKLVNIPQGYSARVVTQGINSVKVIGAPDDISSLSSSDVIGEIDLMNANIKEEGRYTVPVTVKFPSKSGVWAYGEYTAVVSVSGE